MSGSTSKKIVAIRFDREPLRGFVNPVAYLQPGGIEVLTSSGSVVTLSYTEVKALCYVKDFESASAWKVNRAFASRPKVEGLWVKIRFRDGDTMEGLIGNNLLLMEELGFSVAPPDGGFQNRIFVPRAAVTHIQVLGVVGSPIHRARKAKPEDQLKIFE